LIIYFLRHASAGQHKGTRSQDEKRPLDEEGIEQSRYIGRALAAMEVQVEGIICSPLTRATQTASLVANELGHEAKLELSAALRPDADYDDFLKLLDANAAKDSIMVVGHNPTISAFLSLLITRGASRDAVGLKKGAVAKVEVAGRKPAVLRWLFLPALVRAVYDSKGTSSRPKTPRK
jgi:phosphohistidine phosphatase